MAVQLTTTQFTQPKTSGSTTSAFPTTLNLQPTMGVTAKSPQTNITTASNTLPTNQMNTTSTTASGGIDYNANPYYLRPNESIDQYYARIGFKNPSAGASTTPANPTAPMTAGVPSNAQNTQNTQNTQTTQATSNTQTSNQNASPYTATAPSYGGLIGTLAYQGSQNAGTSGQAYQDYLKAVDNLNSLKQQYAQSLGNIESNPIPLEFQQGRSQVLSRQYASQLDAAQQAVNQTQAALGFQLQGQGLQQQALQQAAGLASPIQVPYSNQLINPATGQTFGGSGGSLQDAVKSVVQKLQTGQMSYSDAVQALSGYGQGGMNALQQALPSGFNVAQSNTLAGQQGSIGPAYSFAKSALTNLQNVVSQLGTLQGSNIPAANAIGNWISLNFGLNSDKTRQYIGAVQEARNAYAQLLAASRGGTPTEYSAQANAAIPDNATPNDIQAAINNLESLGQSKLNIYGNPGTSNVSGNVTTSNSGNLYSW